MPTAIITREALDPRACEVCVAGEANGAVCTFIGQVRNHSRGNSVAFLEYDAFVPLAQKEMLRIASEAESRWPVQVAIYHRFGRMEIGEASVVISVGSPHRGDAFDACRWCIDTLKVDVPIWKRETGPDGAHWIEGDSVLKAEGS